MLQGNSIVIQGFTIPSDNPIFLTILAIHVVVALVAVISGVVAMLLKKQSGLHTKFGNIYFWAILIVFITATIIAILRWAQDYYLFILGFISFASVFIAKRAANKKQKKWIITHIMGMGLSYVFLIIAFYVDNGKFLPIWKDFNPIIYWLLPIVIGVPIIIKVVLTHPLSRHYFKK
ncbi:MAG TPA: hypothetical protein VN698_01345 [Bacteroidia bacterium]|nr:hypothetical protein [Bacteroidia bacterium]